MPDHLLCHMLIGPPGSGKSILAQQMQTLIPHSQIISTDRIRQDLYGDPSHQGNWEEIEAIALREIRAATLQNHSVIYDATNAKRAWRMALLHHLTQIAPHWIGWHLTTPRQTCQQRNQRRDRPVPPHIIDCFDQYLQQFPPLTSEGFIAVFPITPSDSLPQVENRLNKLSRSIINRTNRTQHRHITFHRYSQLVDFDRLMHLISLLVQYPGLGNFHQTQPQQLTQILTDPIQPITHAIDEICAVLAQQQGAIYAIPSAIAQDLAWLEHNGFLSPTPTTAPLSYPEPTHNPINPHPYSDWDTYQRLLLTVRFITHHPFCWNPEQPKSLTSLISAMQQQGLLPGEQEASLRKDIEQVLKPFNILPPFRLRRGYFIGTGILSEPELLKVASLLQSQATKIQDPLALSLLETLCDRLRRSQHDLENLYPVRVIANRMMIDPDTLPSEAIARHPDDLEAAIESGQCIEMKRYSHSGRHDHSEPDNFFKAWPLQIVFYNIAWYLGYELAEGPRKGLLTFERLDRLFLGRQLTQRRSRQSQNMALHHLQALQNACSGLYLGTDPKIQKRFLSPDPAIRAAASLQLELWFTDSIFAFISEGTQRFSLSQMKMSPYHPHQAIRHPDLFSLPRSSDSKYPHRLQITLPIWSINDIDLRRWVLGFGAQVKVVAPISIKDIIYKTGQEITQVYEN